MVGFSRCVLWAIVFLAAGCGAKNKGKSGLWRKIIRSGDQLYLARDQVGDLDRAIQWYLSGVREFPDQSRMMGRLSRAYVARAYGHPDDGLDGYTTAREFGLKCLMTDPSFNGLVQSAGGRVTRRAIETLGPEYVECMTWTSLAWSRWLDQRGVVGASIDLSAVKALARRAVFVKDRYDDGRPNAALGLALALAPKPLGPKLKEAREAFDRAISTAPGRLTYQVDMAQYVSAAEGKAGEWSATLNAVVNAPVVEVDPDKLENDRAVARARTLLAAGMDARWD